MAKFENNGFINIDGAIYNPAFMRCQFVNMGQYQEVNLWHNNAVIFTASNDPNSPHKNNVLFDETDLAKGANKAINKMSVISNFNISVFYSATATGINTFKGRVINQANTFAVGNIVAPTENGYVKSVLATQDKWGFFIVIDANSISFRITTDPGEYTVTGHGWGAPGTLLFHAQTDGVLTSTPPTSGQFVPALASVVDDNTIYFQPDLINRRLV